MTTEFILKLSVLSFVGYSEDASSSHNLDATEIWRFPLPEIPEMWKSQELP
jgi:hypothetical protein